MENQKNNFAVPIAIIVAGLIIAGAVYFGGGVNGGTTKKDNAKIARNEQGGAKEERTAQENNVKPVSSDDHIRGNPNAKVKLIEFSDPECPFCKRHHNTMNKIMEEYGKSGQVAWVYRHFPLNQPDSNGNVLHSKAGKESEALECANEQGGNTKFWEYLDELFIVTPSNNGLNLNELPNIASEIGLDADKFNKCLNSGKYAKKITDDQADGYNSGASGTPYNIVIAGNGKKFIINGALPFANIKAVIDQALAEK